MRAFRSVLCAAVCATVVAVVPAAPEPLAPMPRGLVLAQRPAMNALPVRDELATTVRDALATSGTYFLGAWWERHMSAFEPVASWGERLRTDGTLDSEQVRRYSSVAVALAVPIAIGSYDARVTGVPPAVARDRAVALVQLLVRTHAANAGPAGWGGSWQSGLWAAQTALAGWLCGPALDEPHRLLLARMLESEADTIAAAPLHYYRDRDGTVLTPGDSGSEEVAWDSVLLLTAVELLPHHAARRWWAEKAYERLVAAYSRPSDVSSRTVVNGRPLSEWLRGSNIEQSGAVVNWGRVNADYMVSMSLHGAVVPALLGEGVPAALLHGNGAMHAALTSLPFAAPPHRAPGGAIYVPGSARVYYPGGVAWGTQRQVVFGVFDLQVAALGLDPPRARVPARTWAALHLGHVRRLQARFTTGQTYGHISEDRYFAREEWTGALLAYAELFEWLSATGRFRVDHRPPSAKAPVGLSPREACARITGSAPRPLGGSSCVAPSS